MSWAHSLIRLSTYEVETLQKRLAEAVGRREAAEMKRLMLDAEGEAEARRANEDVEAGWSHAAFIEGLRARKAAADADIARLALEEQGARDALAEAFEAQKKYEHVAEAARLLAKREAAKRETVAMDELGVRRAAGGR